MRKSEGSRSRMQDFHASLPGAILHQRKCLINALTGEVKHYFKWTVTRLTGTYPPVGVRALRMNAPSQRRASKMGVR
jgi:hypothetical protein